MAFSDFRNGLSESRKQKIRMNWSQNIEKSWSDRLIGTGEIRFTIVYNHSLFIYLSLS
jgi:hypothetical protein